MHKELMMELKKNEDENGVAILLCESPTTIQAFGTNSADILDMFTTIFRSAPGFKHLVKTALENSECLPH